MAVYVLMWATQLSRYSDWLWAGWSGIESRWGGDFPSIQTSSGAHPAPFKMGTGSFPGVKCGRGVLLTTHPLLVPRSWKSRAIPVPTLWACNGIILPYICLYGRTKVEEMWELSVVFMLELFDLLTLSINHSTFTIRIETESFMDRISVLQAEELV